ncbi:MAG: helix-turn-helix domain-containing protein [Elusimicrobia bacterium]|nr:helix-turn-helix domain-containing protein [Elusimicrobiota bacterium]
MRRLGISDARQGEQVIWREIMRSAESRYDHRLHGVLSVCRGLSCYETAAVWGRSPRSLEHWVRRYEDQGLSGLKERPRPGRPAALTSSERARLQRELMRDPVRCGWPDARWSGGLVRAHLARRYQRSLSLRQCQRLLRKLGA